MSLSTFYVSDPTSNSVTNQIQWKNAPDADYEWSGFSKCFRRPCHTPACTTSSVSILCSVGLNFVDGIAADPTSDWSAPSEHWGNYEEPPVLASPAPVPKPKEQPVPNKVCGA